MRSLVSSDPWKRLGEVVLVSRVHTAGCLSELQGRTKGEVAADGLLLCDVTVYDGLLTSGVP